MTTLTWAIGLMATFTSAVPQSQPARKLDPVADRRPEFVEKLGAACPLNNIAGVVPLHDVLDAISDRAEIPIWIDPVWVRHGVSTGDGGLGLPPLMGKADHQKNFVLARTARQLDLDLPAVAVPASKNVRLASFLTHVLAQVDATYLLRPDHILVTSISRAGTLVAREGPPVVADPLLDDPSVGANVPETYSALVQLVGEKKSMAELFDLVAAQTGTNVLVSPSVAEKVKAEISIRLYNAPVRTAVESLAQMVELGVIERGNVLIVTTPERAEAWAKKQREAEEWRMKQDSARLNQFQSFGGNPVP